jgi:hypothetical protein
VILRGWFPGYLVRLGFWLALAAAVLGIAHMAETWWPCVFAAVPAARALHVAFRYDTHAVLLHPGWLVCRQGALSAAETRFTGSLLRIATRRSLFGRLVDVGDVTVSDWNHEVTMRGIAQLRVIEAWYTDLLCGTCTLYASGNIR